jgi:hypothetical protein
MATPRTPQVPTLEQPYIVLMRFMGVWHIETFATLDEAHDRARALRLTSKKALIGVVWLLELIPHA